MRVRIAAMCAAAALTAPAVGNAQSNTADAVRNWSAIQECGGISDADRRLGCMDDVLRRAAGEATTARAPAPRADQQAAASGSTVTQPAPASPSSRASAAPANREPGPISTKIASVREVGFQRVLVTTAEGTVWEQSEAEAFLTLPKVGDTFTIQPAAMNSFRCKFNRSPLYRCRQVN